MTHHPTHTGHQALIQAALDDYWLTTDPTRPFDTHDATTHIDTYLISSGYQVTPDTRKNRMPTRLSIALTLFLALVCLAGTAACALDREWGWTLVSLVGAGVFTQELVSDLTARRHHRARSAAPNSPESRQQ